MFQRKLVVQQWNLDVDPLENQKYFRRCLLSGLPNPKPIKASNGQLFYFNELWVISSM